VQPWQVVRDGTYITNDRAWLPDAVEKGLQEKEGGRSTKLPGGKRDRVALTSSALNGSQSALIVSHKRSRLVTTREQTPILSSGTSEEPRQASISYTSRSHSRQVAHRLFPSSPHLPFTTTSHALPSQSVPLCVARPATVLRARLPDPGRISQHRLYFPSSATETARRCFASALLDASSNSAAPVPIQSPIRHVLPSLSPSLPRFPRLQKASTVHVLRRKSLRSIRFI
jgi:hypothetical protein